MAEPTGAPENDTQVDDVQALQTQLGALEQERDQYRDMAQRTRAEFENYQKHATREAAQEKRYAHSGLAYDLLGVLDNFDRALAAAKQAGDNSPLAQGISIVQSQMLDLLRRHGITLIESEGQTFDPNLHQAVMQRPTTELPPNSVMEVLEKGFRVHDRVLRPARVIVSAAPQGDDARS